MWILIISLIALVCIALLAGYIRNQRLQKKIERGELDAIPELEKFADKLEKATLATIENGVMTKDLAQITTLKDVTVLNSHDFIGAIRKQLEAIL